MRGESYRWSACFEQSTAVLAPTATSTAVQDREGDLYETFVRERADNLHLLIRSKMDRTIQLASGEQAHLHDYRNALTEMGQHTIKVRDRDTGKERNAVIAIKSAPVTLLRGNLRAAYMADYPTSVSLNVVYAEEVASSVPAGKPPIFWCILTTHKVETLEEAIQITYWYSMRWLIELLFRLVKKDGFRLESSELETGYALRKLGILTMEAAVKVLQLKQARGGDETLPIATVFTDHEVECLEKLTVKLEGVTEKQQNPFKTRTLPWATWIIARLGGWNGYKNNRPPGILTLKMGLDKFNIIYIGFTISTP